MNLGTPIYNDWHDIMKEGMAMPKGKGKLKETNEVFGQRLAQLRQAAGYSQRELASEVGVSHRMVAYYETEAKHLPPPLLPKLAKALEVSMDQLLGGDQLKDNGKRRDTRLWRRFSQVEKLPTPQRKQITQILDAFLGMEKMKENSSKASKLSSRARRNG